MALLLFFFACFLALMTLGALGSLFVATAVDSKAPDSSTGAFVGGLMLSAVLSVLGSGALTLFASVFGWVS